MYRIDEHTKHVIVTLKEEGNSSLHVAEELGISEQKIKVGDWNINYVKVGTGPHSVLCMPGALGSIWSDFKPQVEGLNRDKFTVVVWDPPGYGDSRPRNRDFSQNFYEKEATCAYEFMKVLQITKFSILGWCGGGRAAMILSAKYPDAINKLVLWGTNSFILPQQLELYNKYKNIDSWSVTMRKFKVALYGEDFLRKYWTQFVEGIINLCNANDGNICSELLKDIKCPTFILHGEMDPLVFPDQASYLHSHIEDSRLHLYPNGKHNIHLALAKDFNTRVENFLSSKV